jgi:hypothetical protein
MYNASLVVAATVLYDTWAEYDKDVPSNDIGYVSCVQRATYRLASPIG